MYIINVLDVIALLNPDMEIWQHRVGEKSFDKLKVHNFENLTRFSF